MPAEPATTVVVPVYGNAETLEELHARLAAALDAAGISFELLFVDDASPDGAARLLAGIVERDPRVGAILLARNVGQHRAALAGLLHARGRSAVLLDGDLQDPPEAVPLLLATLGPDAAAVFAGRRGRYESAGRLLTSRVYKTLLHVVAGVPRDAGMFVAMTREMRDAILSMDDPTPFVVALLGAAGLPLRSIPVSRDVRPRGRTAYSSWMRFRIGSRAILRALTWRPSPRSGARRPCDEVRALIGRPFARGIEAG